jgi:dTDP-4-amino-4,6-dideoxygalactose transaminase
MGEVVEQRELTLPLYPGMEEEKVRLVTETLKEIL